MKKPGLSTNDREDGILENLFIFLAIATAVLVMGSLSVSVIRAQRYQAGLDLSTHNAIRDLVAAGPLQDPRRLALSDLNATFESMDLNTTGTTTTVSDSGGRCGTVIVTETKTLGIFPRHLVEITLRSAQRESADALASGLEGIATCIGS